MSDTSPHTQIVTPPPPLFDEAELAVAGFLARYRGNTRTGYRTTCVAGSPGARSTTWPSSTPDARILSCGHAPWKNTNA